MKDNVLLSGFTVQILAILLGFVFERLGLNVSLVDLGDLVLTLSDGIGILGLALVAWSQSLRGSAKAFFLGAKSGENQR